MQCKIYELYVNCLCVNQIKSLAFCKRDLNYATLTKNITKTLLKEHYKSEYQKKKKKKIKFTFTYNKTIPFCYVDYSTYERNIIVNGFHC